MIFLGGILGAVSSQVIELFGADEVFSIQVRRGLDVQPLSVYVGSEIAFPVLFIGDRIFLESLNFRLMVNPGD